MKKAITFFTVLLLLAAACAWAEPDDLDGSPPFETPAGVISTDVVTNSGVTTNVVTNSRPALNATTTNATTTNATTTNATTTNATTTNATTTNATTTNAQIQPTGETAATSNHTPKITASRSDSPNSTASASTGGVSIQIAIEIVTAALLGVIAWLLYTLKAVMRHPPENPGAAPSAAGPSSCPEWVAGFKNDVCEAMRATIREESANFPKAANAVATNPGSSDLGPSSASGATVVVATVDVGAILAEAKAQAESSLAKDQKEQVACDDNLRKWNTRVNNLREFIKATAQDCGKQFLKAKQELDSLPLEVQEKLKGRQEALDLIGKMLARLEANVPAANELSPPPFSSLDDESLRKQIAEITEAAVAREVVRAKLKDISTERYAYLRQLREAAEKLKKAFFTFVTRQVLPILDGLDEGERTSKPLIEALKSTLNGSAEKLDQKLEQWSQTYVVLRQSLLDLLRKFQVHQILVTPGESANYERHEPFEIEADPSLKNEQIKSVTRNGYEYQEGTMAQVLRPAQVVLVKN